MGGLTDAVRKRLAGRESLQEALADAKTKRAELDARRRSSRELRLRNADTSIANALAWVDAQIDRYGGAEAPLRAEPGPGDELPRVARWAAIVGGPEALFERWRARLAVREGLHDDSIKALDREAGALDGEISRLDGEISALDAERAQLRDALS